MFQKSVDLLAKPIILCQTYITFIFLIKPVNNLYFPYKHTVFLSLRPVLFPGAYKCFDNVFLEHMFVLLFFSLS